MCSTLPYLGIIQTSSPKDFRLRAIAVEDGEALRPALPDSRRVEVEGDVVRPELAADDRGVQQAALHRFISNVSRRERRATKKGQVSWNWRQHRREEKGG